MLALATAALSLILPTPPALIQSMPVRASVLVADTAPGMLFPTTTLSGGLIKADKAGDTFSGGMEDMSLSELLDNIPKSDLDLQGEKGMKRDANGVARLKERQAREAEAALDKYEEVMAAEAAALARQE